MRLNEVKRCYWAARFALWSPAARHPERGYTVLVPVPGDIPVLTDLSLAALSRQNGTHRVATIVVPDVVTDEVAQTVSRWREHWTGPLSLLPLRAPERFLLPRLRDPGKNHAAQLLRGVAASDSTHVIFHDADLFPLDPHLHERLWHAAASNVRAVSGVDAAWDSFYAQHGRELVATWEACADVDWLRSFAPWRHFAHEGTLASERHVADTTFWPQWHTHQSRLEVLDESSAFVHFNYVISTFRHFQRSDGSFYDQHFRLVLLRVLTDLFGRSGPTAVIPSLTELARGLHREDAPVFFRSDDAPLYRQMRRRLEAILVASTDARQLEDCQSALEPFDRWAAEDAPGTFKR